MFRLGLATVLGLLICAGGNAQDTQAALGIFEGHSDVGDVLHPGSAEYDAGTKTYTVTGSGENMWFGKDEFHFVWKKISADDLTLTANIAILGTGGNEHRKAVLMVRQSLDGTDAYVDAARHGEGLTSLQFREKKGATTHEIESNVSGPATLRLEKRGSRFYLWIAKEHENLEFSGGSAWVDMRTPFYVGIGVCAHDKDATEKATFTNVELDDTKPKHSKEKGKYSTIETVLLSGDARAGYVSERHLTSPGWSADGKELTFEAGNEHQQTPFTPLRTAAPVGAAIVPPPTDFTYFAGKSGDGMQIWRKSVDGSQSQQFTPDDFSNTSPHISPDGKYLLFLSYSKEYDKLGENMPLELRLMSLKDNSIKTLVTFIGGEGSLGPQPWSPDGKRVVFISYQSMK